MEEGHGEGILCGGPRCGQTEGVSFCPVLMVDTISLSWTATIRTRWYSAPAGSTSGYSREGRRLEESVQIGPRGKGKEPWFRYKQTHLRGALEQVSRKGGHMDVKDGNTVFISPSTATTGGSVEHSGKVVSS
jgi:hypothetical protein